MASPALIKIYLQLCYIAGIVRSADIGIGGGIGGGAGGGIGGGAGGGIGGGGGGGPRLVGLGDIFDARDRQHGSFRCVLFVPASIRGETELDKVIEFLFYFELRLSACVILLVLDKPFVLKFSRKNDLNSCRLYFQHSSDDTVFDDSYVRKSAENSELLAMFS